MGVVLHLFILEQVCDALMQYNSLLEVVPGGSAELVACLPHRQKCNSLLSPVGQSQSIFFIKHPWRLVCFNSLDYTWSRGE